MAKLVTHRVSNIKRLGIGIGVGAAVGFLAYLFSGGDGSSVPIGILVAYLEFRFNK